MCPRKTGASIVNVLGYSIPTLHEGKQWYVDFYALDPTTKEVRRKKYYITKEPTKRAMRLSANTLIDKLSTNLRRGWNPWLDNKNTKSATPFQTVLDKYLNYLQVSHRARSIVSYTSRVRMLREYMETLQSPPMYAIDYTREFIIDFLDWITDDRGDNARTRNNYKGWCSSLGEYMVDRGYLSSNPAATVKKLNESKKIRQPLTEKMLRDLFGHLRKTDKHFLLACMMEYFTFIRPHELSHVRIRDISVKEMTVFIPGEHSKNKKDGKVSLNESILSLMIELGVLNNPIDWYLFGSKFKPSPDIANSDIFNKRFAMIRGPLKIPATVKFYSLKDSGIRDLSNSAGVVTARNQARHHDISTTNKYLQGQDLDAPEAAKHFSGVLDN